MTIKQVHGRLEKSLQQIRDKVEHRKAIYHDRSEEWRCSEKGDEYDFRTRILADAAKYLSDAIDILIDYDRRSVTIKNDLPDGFDSRPRF